MIRWLHQLSRSDNTKEYLLAMKQQQQQLYQQALQVGNYQWVIDRNTRIEVTQSILQYPLVGIRLNLTLSNHQYHLISQHVSRCHLHSMIIHLWLLILLRLCLTCKQKNNMMNDYVKKNNFHCYTHRIETWNTM